ncbi:MAG: site-specific DNA-methyltransferase [Candidatus Obscuribacter sp.]|nr:site-specific DNA-methyltransferase [Candidatus Obscuribacter sp.]
MPTVEKVRERLVDKLKELFQLDQPDLDFGFYRIMHVKADQVRSFIENDLLSTVQDCFRNPPPARIEELRSEYEKAVQTAREFGAEEPEKTEPVKKAKAALEASTTNSSHESEVYDHLYRFFKRYYEDADFISRRYFTRETTGKAAPYAIPYNGEEVKLHWTNVDQYFIKSSEYFTNFTVDLKYINEQLSIALKSEPIRLCFRVISASEGEHGEIKPSDTTKRFFLIHKAKPLEFAESGDLNVNFEYRPDLDKPAKERDTAWRDKRNKEAALAILSELEKKSITNTKAAEYLRLLQTPAPTESDKKRPVLEKYINQYTARNCTDYFIHKDLGGFLRRELDFYIKNEVMRLDDIESAEAPIVETYLSKLRVLRSIGGKLADFLAQLEDFQKRLWLKKKFVVETHWCISLRTVLSVENENVRHNLMTSILNNHQQFLEWQSLGFISKEIVSEKIPRDEAFLSSHPTLMVDTRNFDISFTQLLLDSIVDLEEHIDGLLINSDNFHGLSIIQKRFFGQVRCIVIDPPYNRLSDGFPYKDSYRHASWLTMMRDRTELGWTLLRNDGALFSNIDENERDSLQVVLDGIFGRDNRVEELIWAQNTTHSQSPLYSTNHEYVQVYARDRITAERDPLMFREPKPGFSEVTELVKRMNDSYPPVSQVESEIKTTFKQHIEEYKAELREQGLQYDEETKKQDPWRGIYNYSHVEYRDARWIFVRDSDARDAKAELWVWREDNPSGPAQKQADSTRDPNDPNYRFYRPLHPENKQPCPYPKRGWLWPFTWPDKTRDCFKDLDLAGRIAWGDDETKIPQYKRFLHEVETNVAKSVFHDYTDGEKQIAALFGSTGLFPTPKPTTLPIRFISQVAEKNDLILDYFSGSGTTGHATIHLNREDGGRRQFVLIEQANYFWTILLPRLKKVIYTPEWKDGVPSRPPTDQESDFSPRVLKIVRLETLKIRSITLNTVLPTLGNQSLRKHLLLRRLICSTTCWM